MSSPPRSLDSRRRGLTLALALALAPACAEPGQRPITATLRVAGTSLDGPFEGKGGALLSLSRADLAFGPLYLCAGAQAGDLCETARMEWLESAVVDATDPESHGLGELRGVTGTVRSWMYDLGFTSLLTESAPLELDAADALGGHSIVLEGEARVGEVTIPFTAALAIQQEEQTERGIPVIRKSASEPFEHELSADQDSALLIRFDPRPWARAIDFAVLLTEEPCAPDGPALSCQGTVEQTCADGGVERERDCAAEDALCIRDLGCVDHVMFEPGSQGLKAVRDQVVSGPRPEFTWSAS